MSEDTYYYSLYVVTKNDRVYSFPLNCDNYDTAQLSSSMIIRKWRESKVLDQEINWYLYLTIK
jgi:hypothetical protein